MGIELALNPIALQFLDIFQLFKLTNPLYSHCFSLSSIRLMLKIPLSSKQPV